VRFRALAAVVGVAWILVRLFTYEFVLRDDPMGGIALRAVPGLSVGPKLLEPDSKILLQDENGFAGEGLYRAFAGYGWLLCLLVAGYAFWANRRALRPERSGPS
jgi:hypothetical protein